MAKQGKGVNLPGRGVGRRAYSDGTLYTRYPHLSHAFPLPRRWVCLSGCSVSVTRRIGSNGLTLASHCRQAWRSSCLLQSRPGADFPHLQLPSH